MTEIPDAYTELGVRPDCSQQELRAVHRRLVRRWHPDVASAAERAEATRRLQRLNVAYGLVCDPARRATYDRLRRLQRARGAGLHPPTDDEWAALAAAAGRWAGRWWSRITGQPRSARSGRASAPAVARGLGRVVGTLRYRR